MRIILFFTFFISIAAIAQTKEPIRCATTETTHHILQKYPEYQKSFEELGYWSEESGVGSRESEVRKWEVQNHKHRNTPIPQYRNTKKNVEETITIPIVVHILHNQSDNDITGNNISEVQILSQIDRLNADYGGTNEDLSSVPSVFQNAIAEGTGIQFCLATITPAGNPTSGVTRTFTNKTSFDNELDDCKFSSMGGVDAWNPCEYMNIWVVPSINNDEVLGYAQFPGVGPAQTDGVVIAHYTFGDETGTASNGNFTKGRTATHEIGHYLGLLHTWGDDGGGCDGDDTIADTPNQGGFTTGCPSTILFSCGSQDMTMNFLDYSYDACLTMFTNGQAARMQDIINSHPMRSCLLNSPAMIACTTPQECIADYGLLSLPNEQNVCFGGENESIFIFNDENSAHETVFLLANENEVIVGINNVGKFDFAEKEAGDYTIHPFNYLNNQSDDIFENLIIGTTTIPVFQQATSIFCVDLMTVNPPVFSHLPELKIAVLVDCSGGGSGKGTLVVGVNGGDGNYIITGNQTGDVLQTGDTYNVQVQDGTGCQAIKTGIVDCGVVGLNDDFFNEISVFPTIFTQNVQISGLNAIKSDFWVEVFDLNGRLVKSQFFEVGQIDNLQLNLGNGLGGIYIIQVSVEGTKKQWKVVKM